ncbi:helicase C-terminal domain-containing protein [Methanococcoides sp. FTZ1]|uniref:helicase C-terminal domain-containing protein n=1 Tax=Methanococcoides sp. FTZ1 TaxID=3439061 RepID=UPI003F87DB16
MNIHSQEIFALDLSTYILSKISGTHEDDEIINTKPSNTYLIGTLAARKDQSHTENSGYVDRKEDDSSSMRATSMKLSVLIDKSEFIDKTHVSMKAMGNVYYKIKNPDADPDQDIEKFLWKRNPFEFSYNIDISSEIELALDFPSLIDKINSFGEVSPKIPVDTWKGRINVSLIDYDEHSMLVSFEYENTKVEPSAFVIDENGTQKRTPRNFDNTLFNCNLEIDFDGLKINKFVDDYVYDGYNQKYFYAYRSKNCQGVWGEKKQKLRTEHFGRFEQENIIPRSKIPGIDLSFENLSKKSNAISALESFVEEMNKYSGIYTSAFPTNVKLDEFQPLSSGENRQRTWRERNDLINHFDKMIEKVDHGVELIKSDDVVYNCFLRTNEAFNNYYNTIDHPISNAGWRLFQLAFFLSSICSVVEEKDLEIVDVLHVDTGGGKSEAYFSLLVFSMFYERAVGKKEGVTGIVKFPLRMLSIQQLERLSSIIMHAEHVRSSNNSLFEGEQFSLGYFVGSTDDDFPDMYSKIRDTLYSKDKLIDPAPISKIISKCPLCEPGNKGTIRLIDDNPHKRILHKCDKCGFVSQIYYSDREVYRWRPTIIVSTVDKWAGMSLQQKVRGILGGSGSHCPDGHGFIPAGDLCEKKEEEGKCDHLGSCSTAVSGPRLSIQDEMHLLSEGFGTISAHFEGLIDEMVKNTSGRPLKHIAMSATINGAQKQISELYKKGMFVIPGRCPEGVGSKNDFFFLKKDGPKRIIYGMKPNLRDNHYATLSTLLHTTEFLIEKQKELNSDSAKFCSRYELDNLKDAQKLLNRYLIPLTYHIKKQDAYNMMHLQETVIGDALKKNHSGSKVLGHTLTGDNNLEQLKNSIDNVHKYVYEYDPNAVDKESFIFSPLYSTSVVSHGVDLDELNVMVFQGLPYSTSEYIQALSRVGRKHLGIVMLWFYPNRVRDDSFFRNFNRYHNSLDHEVKPVPINRYSKLGMKQTVNSMFCAGILNYLSNKKCRALYRLIDVKSLDEKDWLDLIEFIQNVYGGSGIDLDVYKEVEERKNQILFSNESENKYFPNILTKSGNPLYRTQTGMRGLQKQLALELWYKDEDLLRRMGVLK